MDKQIQHYQQTKQKTMQFVKQNLGQQQTQMFNTLAMQHQTAQHQQGHQQHYM